MAARISTVRHQGLTHPMDADPDAVDKSVADQGLMTADDAPDPEPSQGTMHWNHVARVFAFPDGTFLAPGPVGGLLSQDMMDLPQTKALIKMGHIKTEPYVPTKAELIDSDGNDIDGEPGQPTPGEAPLA